MSNERIAKHDLDLACQLINFHSSLVQFAHYNHDELSPEALAILREWLHEPSKAISDANLLTKQGIGTVNGME